jgi:CrcB protein
MVDPGVLVGAGGVVGALLRYVVYETLPTGGYPLATLVVNVVGSFVLGVITFAGAGEGVLLFVGVGVCGAFTTYSTFAVDTVRLWEEGNVQASVFHAASNLVCSLAGVGLAWLLV